MSLNACAIFEGIDSEFDNASYGYGYSSMNEWEDFLASTQPLVESIKEKDKGFYRINQGYEYTKNDGMLLGYNGLFHYSSMYNGNVNTLMSNLGLAQASIWNAGYGSTPLTDSFFAVKYVIDDTTKLPDFYEQIEETTMGTASYVNNSALPIAFSASVTTLFPALNSESPFENQNLLMNAIMKNQEKYFEEYDYLSNFDEQIWTYTFIANSDNPVYLYMPRLDEYFEADVYVNGQWIGNYFTPESNCNLYLGDFNVGEKVEVIINLPKKAICKDSAIIVQLKVDVLEKTLQKLQIGGMQIDEYKNGYLTGEVCLNQGEMVITSIPYDSGWTVKVDGEKVKIQKFADTFIAFDAPEGSHEVSFSYAPPMLIQGSIVGGICILLYCMIWGIKRRTF